MDLRSHVAQVVARVVAAEVERTGAQGVVIASPPGDARNLLASWLTPTMSVLVAPADATAPLEAALEPTGAPAHHRRAVALRAWAEAKAAAEPLLPVATLDKTGLLLGSGPLPARVLPLGDLFASDLRAMDCSVKLPPVLRGFDPDEVRRVDAALRAYLEGGDPPHVAFASLGELAERVRRALDAGEQRRRGLLVPKLARWTPGIDLDR